MVFFPNCKINLGLNIIGKRADGYHAIETLFYPIAVTDVLEAVRGAEEGIRFRSTGLAIAGNTSDNLCVKAYHLLQKDFPDLLPVQMHLHKAIPTGAGLGGGSANGAFALKLLNKMGNLALSTEQLMGYALQLGSDCPFFILNQPCFATGRGEIMEPVTLDLSAYRFVIVHPGIHISTAAAFARIHPAQPAKSVREIVQQPVATWKNELVNDFEEAVFASQPVIASLKQELYQQGALYASMTGSGSAVYGIFHKESRPLHVFDPNWHFFEIG